MKLRIDTLTAKACAVVLALAPALTSSAALPAGKIYANLIAKGSTAESYSQVYTLSAQGQSEYTRIGNYYSNSLTTGGTFDKDERIIGFNITAWGKNFSIGTLNADTDQWTKTFDYYTLVMGATDMTTDPLTGTVYGCFYTTNPANTPSSPTYLGYLNAEGLGVNTTTTKIADLDKHFYVLAADENGKLYGIDGEGKLYRIDKTTGALTEIGSTGVVPMEYYQQSGAFNPANGQLYWAAYTAGREAALYTVNPRTAAATKLYDFPSGERWAAMYISAPETDPLAPAAVSDLNAAMNSSKDGIDISFTVPTVSYGGTTLSGSLTWHVAIDGDAKGNQTAAVGTPVSVSYDAAEGMHTVTVWAEGMIAGVGPKTTVEVYVGKDNPAQLDDVKLAADGYTTNLTWTAPTAGLHGTPLDAAKLAYTVTRMPEGTVVAENTTETAFTETIETDELRSVSYKITVYYDGEECFNVVSPAVLVGPAATVPYSQNFDGFAEFSGLGYYANNGNWSLETSGENTSVKLASNSEVGNSVFSCPITMRKGHKYTFQFDYKLQSYWGARFGVILTSAQNNESKVADIIALKSFTQAVDFTTVEAVEFTVPENGTYYFAFTADRMSYDVWFDNVVIADVSGENIPEAVADLAVEVTDHKARTATISFTVPTATTLGDDLEPKQVDLYYNEALLKSWTTEDAELAAGAQLSYQHEGIEAGEAHYTVTVTDANGTSRAAEASAKVGFDFNVGIVSISSNRDKVKPGEQFTITVAVENDGTANFTEEITVYLTQNGTRAYMLTIEDLPKGETHNFEFLCTATADMPEESVYTADIEADGDEYEADNKSGECLIGIDKSVGVDGVDAAAAKVYAEGGQLHVEGAAGAVVAVHTPAGALVAEAVAGDSYSLSVAPGLYLVSVGTETFKVAVR